MAITKEELDRILGKQSALDRVFASNKPTMQSYTPSTFDVINSSVQQKLEQAGLDRYKARDFTEKFLGSNNKIGLADFTPYGIAKGSEYAGKEFFAPAIQDFSQGNIASGLGGAGLGAGAMILGAGKVPVQLRTAGKAAVSTVDDLLGRFPTTTPSRIVSKTKSGGGYSVNLPTGVTPEEGLMMGMYKNTDPRNTVVEGLLKKSDVEKQSEMNAKQLANQDVYFGTWFNPDDKMTYLDVSKRFNPKELRKAVKFGERTGQLAGYNVGKGESFNVGNWNDFVKSPEYAQRLTELNKTGTEYLSQHPTVNWWDLRGTPIEEIYGAENIPNIAGYLAATSPVSDVPRNTRIASEYMRRQLAGEPVIQPNFRMPETSVFETVGNMMPMETGRKNNLIAASEGRIKDLSKEKVRSMGQALMGDPNAMVFDRHWANLSEKPAENIFTGIEKGVFPSGKQYSNLEKIVAAQAKKEGMSPRDFSANVWTGYRDMAQKQGNVFGVKTAGAGIQGESKSIADTFMDQLTVKANKLGISKQEMIKKLKSGDMSLLSLLAIPVVPTQEQK